MTELIEDEIRRQAKQVNTVLTDKQVREIAFDIVKDERFNRFLSGMIQDLIDKHAGTEDEDRFLNKIKKTRKLLEEKWNNDQ